MQKQGGLKNSIVRLKNYHRGSMSAAGRQRMPSGVPTLTQLSPAPFKQSAVKHRKQTFTQHLQKLTDAHLLLEIGSH